MNNSEILYLYDAKQTNPNGDMDNQNKPRMDYDRMINLVSDVRAKRYIRDYLNGFEGEEIFVTNEAETSKDRVEKLIGRKVGKNKPLTKDELLKIIETFIDIRLFGATLATEGGNDNYTGPIQFTWGYSLNKVELEESKTITSSFSSGEGIGKDYRVKYSFLAFSGSINGKTGEKVNLSEEDVKLFDKATIKSLLASRTRSKIGQTPRLYLRVELKNNKMFLKDLREYIFLEQDEDLYSIKDVKLNVKKLKEYLKVNSEKINKIYYYIDDMLLNSEGEKLTIKDIFETENRENLIELNDEYFNVGE